MMNHGAMLWNAAAYNNGSIDIKNPIVGQGYGADGIPLQLKNPFSRRPNRRDCPAYWRRFIRCRDSI